MTKQEYFDLEEMIVIRNRVGKWYDTITELLVHYPMFKKDSLEEVRDYFSNRMVEVEQEIQKTLNVEQIIFINLNILM